VNDCYRRNEKITWHHLHCSRSTHYRPSALHQLQGPHLQRHRHRRRLRKKPPVKLPSHHRLRWQQPGAAGPADPDRLREHLLQEPRPEKGPPALRPGALQWWRSRRAGPVIRQQPGGLLQGLRGGNDQDGGCCPADGVERADQEELQEDQLNNKDPPKVCKTVVRSVVVVVSSKQLIDSVCPSLNPASGIVKPMYYSAWIINGLRPTHELVPVQPCFGQITRLIMLYPSSSLNYFSFSRRLRSQSRNYTI
jgi:hypothetical protein